MPASAQLALVKEDQSYNFQDIKNQFDSILGTAGLALFPLDFFYEWLWRNSRKRRGTPHQQIPPRCYFFVHDGNGVIGGGL
jgi:hypothetical protein